MYRVRLAASRPGPFADVARALRLLGTWFAPSSAYAAHVGAGGLTGSFSRIGWMLPTDDQFRFHAGLGAGSHPIRTQVNNTYAGIVTFTRVSNGARLRQRHNVYSRTMATVVGDERRQCMPLVHRVQPRITTGHPGQI